MLRKTSHLFTILLFLCLFLMTFRPIEDPDFWWHLKTGEYILKTGALPVSDPFSSTFSGKPWIAHEWLTEIILFSIFKVGGYDLLILIFSSIITSAFLLTFFRSTGRPYAAGFSLLLCAIASAPTWGVRPQMISLLLSAAFLYLLDRFIETKLWRFIIPLPFLMTLWVNLHAGYFLGLVIIGIYILGEFIPIVTRHLKHEHADKNHLLVLFVLLCSCVLFSLINPHGIQILVYPFETLTSDSMMLLIHEWFSPDFHQVEWIPFAFLILALIAFPAVTHRKANITHLMLVLFFGFAALRSMRHIPLFSLVAAPLLADQLEVLLPGALNLSPPRRKTLILNWLILVAVCLLMGLRYAQVHEDQKRVETESFPRLAAEWILENHPEGDLLNNYNWGGYLIWKLYPEYRVYIDGRADVYGDEFLYDFVELYNGLPGWDQTLLQEGVGIVLIEPGSGLAAAIRKSSEWTLVYEDPQSILFVR